MLNKQFSRRGGDEALMPIGANPSRTMVGSRKPEVGNPKPMDRKQEIRRMARAGFLKGALRSRDDNRRSGSARYRSVATRC